MMKRLMTCDQSYGHCSAHISVSAICVLGNPVTLTIGCQAPHDHMITISNLLCGFHRKSNGEGSKEGLKLLSPAEKTTSTLWGSDWKRFVPKSKQGCQPQSSETCFPTLGQKILLKFQHRGFSESEWKAISPLWGCRSSMLKSKHFCRPRVERLITFSER